MIEDKLEKRINKTFKGLNAGEKMILEDFIRAEIKKAREEGRKEIIDVTIESLLAEAYRSGVEMERAKIKKEIEGLLDGYFITEYHNGTKYIFVKYNDVKKLLK